MLVIESPQNPRLKAAMRLRTSRGRQKQSRIIIDGQREVQRAIDSNVQLEELFVCPQILSQENLSQLQAIAEQLSNHCVFQLPLNLFRKIAYGDRADGVVAIANRPECLLENLGFESGEIVAVLEAFENPGNLGAVIRSADGAGINKILIASPATDVFHPNSIRNSMACVFNFQLAVDSTENCLDWLRNHNIPCFAARLDTTESCYQADFTGSSAIVLGNEARGLSSIWSHPNVHGIKLPMNGLSDSLNVSAAAAVIFYEAYRQRNEAE